VNAGVDERVAEADDRDQRDRRQPRGGAEDDQRQAPQSDVDAKRHGEPAATEQPEGEDRSHHGAGSQRRVQDADARRAGVEQVDGHDDGQHVQGAARECLRGPEPRDEQQPAAIAGDRRESLHHRAGVRAGGARCPRGGGS
jgi:hypothetical protein